jgi:hypothetical protein
MINVTRDEFEKQDVDITIGNMPLYGIERAMGVDDSIPTWETRVPFRMKDDDGELMCRGVLDDDPDCGNQSAALRWGESMYGCTLIEVKRDGSWVVEIG